MSVPLNSRIVVKGKFVYYCEVRLVAFGGVGYEFFHKIFTLHARQMTRTEGQYTWKLTNCRSKRLPIYKWSIEIFVLEYVGMKTIKLSSKQMGWQVKNILNLNYLHLDRLKTILMQIYQAIPRFRCTTTNPLYPMQEAT